jgi:hypothetical protein
MDYLEQKMREKTRIFTNRALVLSLSSLRFVADLCVKKVIKNNITSCPLKK